MKLARHTIRVIIFSIIIALLGFVALQYVLLRNAYEFRQQAFERNVHAAMNSIAQKLETKEALGNVFRVAVNLPRSPRKFMTLKMESDSIHSMTTGDSLAIVTIHSQIGDAMPIRVENKVIHYSVPSSQHVSLRVFDLAGRKDTLLVDKILEPGEYVARFDNPGFSSGELVIKYQTDSCLYTLHTVNGNLEGVVKNSTMIEKREEIVSRIVDNLAFSEREPIEKRIRPAILDSIISITLKEGGITLPFVYGVVSDRDDSVHIGDPAGYKNELLSSGYRNRLFPNDILFSGNQLLLYFPGQSVYLLKQVGSYLALTILFLSVIVICFVYTIRTINKQKLFSVRLTDFVNNMTHEFKTPISTIAVAAETIIRPEVIDKADKVLRYSTVIRDENTRMKKQVDTILQMAVLEEGDYELKLSDVDVHEIIRQVVDNVSLQIEPKNGSIERRLDAGRSIVQADIIHLTNIIHNVMDNACKYSHDKPTIVISTSNRNGSITVDITDSGIGISSEDATKVFEKYYRVHTGNVHDVKGFGLGLSYVKLMTEAHGGTVSLESEPGRGTTVHLMFPLSSNRGA